jgi:tetratricopeptide (TPR) repeat protein
MPINQINKHTNNRIMRNIFVAYFMLIISAVYAQNGSGAQDNIGAGYNRASSLSALERQAVKSQNEGDYFSAMQYFGRMLAADSLSIAALTGYGNNAALFAAFERAEWAYQKMADHNLSLADGSVLLRLAETKVRLGKFAEAEQIYRPPKRPLIWHRQVWKTQCGQPVLPTIPNWKRLLKP